MICCRNLLTYKLVTLLTIVVILPLPIYSKNLTGVLYDIPSNRKTALYHWEMTLTAEGLPWKSFYKTLDGELVAWDEVTWDGDSFKGYRYERATINDRGSVAITGESVHFLHIADGKRKEAKESLVRNFTTGPLVIIYILDHWEELTRGEKQTIRYGVIDQASSFGFVLSRDTDHAKSGSGQVVFKMDADSFLIGLFVDPIYFIFREKDKELVGMIGRMLPVGINAEGKHHVDAELVINQ